MRARRLPLILALGLCVFTAGHGDAARRLSAKMPVTARAGGLRGPQPFASAAPVTSASPVPPELGAAVRRTAPAPLITTTPVASLTPSAPAASDCRLACARSYYFCVAAPETSSCSSTWNQCLADCRDPPDPDYAKP